MVSKPRIRPTAILLGVLIAVLIPAAGIWAYAQSRLITHVDGVVACYPEDNAELLDDSQSARMARRQRLSELLLQTGGSSERVIQAAAFLPNTEQMRALSELAAKDPDNRLAALHLLKTCIWNPDAQPCDEEVGDRVTMLDADNAFSQGMVATYRHLKGDEYGASAAMRQAASADRFDDYLGEQIRTFETAVSRDERQRDPLLLFDLVTYSFHSRISGFDYFQYCVESASSQPLLGQYCLELAEDMAEQSPVLINNMIALATQEVLNREMGNSAAASRAAQATRQHREQRRRQSIPGEATTLLAFDQDLAEAWLANIIRFGELEANSLMLSEARAKSTDPDYRPCNGPRVRIEFPYLYAGQQRILF